MATVASEQIEGPIPPGLRLLPGFISPLERAKIAAYLRETLSPNDLIPQPFGSACQFQEPFPGPFHILSSGINGEHDFREGLQSVQANFFAPGAGMQWHTDRPTTGEKAILGLESPCIVEFRKNFHGEISRLLVNPGDFYLLTEDVRWIWEHRIPAGLIQYFHGHVVDRTGIRVSINLGYEKNDHYFVRMAGGEV